MAFITVNIKGQTYQIEEPSSISQHYVLCEATPVSPPPNSSEALNVYIQPIKNKQVPANTDLTAAYDSEEDKAAVTEQFLLSRQLTLAFRSLLRQIHILLLQPEALLTVHAEGDTVYLVCRAGEASVDLLGNLGEPEAYSEQAFNALLAPAPAEQLQAVSDYLEQQCKRTDLPKSYIEAVGYMQDDCQRLQDKLTQTQRFKQVNSLPDSVDATDAVFEAVLASKDDGEIFDMVTQPEFDLYHPVNGKPRGIYLLEANYHELVEHWHELYASSLDTTSLPDRFKDVPASCYQLKAQLIDSILSYAPQQMSQPLLRMLVTDLAQGHYRLREEQRVLDCIYQHPDWLTYYEIFTLLPHAPNGLPYLQAWCQATPAIQNPQLIYNKVLDVKANLTCRAWLGSRLLFHCLEHQQFDLFKQTIERNGFVFNPAIIFRQTSLLHELLAAERVDLFFQLINRSNINWAELVDGQGKTVIDIVKQNPTSALCRTTLTQQIMYHVKNNPVRALQLLREHEDFPLDGASIMQAAMNVKSPSIDFIQALAPLVPWDQWSRCEAALKQAKVDVDVTPYKNQAYPTYALSSSTAYQTHASRAKFILLGSTYSSESSTADVAYRDPNTGQTILHMLAAHDDLFAFIFLLPRITVEQLKSMRDRDGRSIRQVAGPSVEKLLAKFAAYQEIPDPVSLMKIALTVQNLPNPQLLVDFIIKLKITGEQLSVLLEQFAAVDASNLPAVLQIFWTKQDFARICELLADERIAEQVAQCIGDIANSAAPDAIQQAMNYAFENDDMNLYALLSEYCDAAMINQLCEQYVNSEITDHINRHQQEQDLVDKLEDLIRGVPDEEPLFSSIDEEAVLANVSERIEQVSSRPASPLMQSYNQHGTFPQPPDTDSSGQTTNPPTVDIKLSYPGHG